ncbi:uncharacterized protein RJT21DRAFT_3996 [Scheffersomyces amazonensis]|uniref:uncharacterized protein n=1 Tax=Scheffersomyces amazonensis TaxID=1078765 RepID=UPI00315C9320
MQLNDLINFDDVKYYLIPRLKNGKADIFKVHKLGIAHFLRKQKKLEKYIKNPENSDDTKKFLDKLGYDSDTFDIQQDDLLRFLFRFYNFHILQPYKFSEVTFDITEAVKVIIHNSFIKRFGAVIVKQLSGYLKVTTNLSMRKPTLHRIDQTDNNNQPTKPHTEIRHNRLKGLVGNFYPDKIISKIPKMEGELDFNKSMMPMKPRQDLVCESESIIQECIKQNLFEPIADTKKEFLVTNGYRIAGTSSSGAETRVIPDLVFMRLQQQIPIEVKKCNLEKYIYDFQLKGPNDALSISFIEVFSQLIREIYKSKSSIGILSDYQSILVVDVSKCSIGKVTGIEEGKILRQLKCKAILLSDSPDYSVITQLFGLLNCQQMSIQLELELNQTAKDLITRELCIKIVTWNKHIHSYATKNRIYEEHRGSDNQPNPPSADPYIKDLSEKTGLDINESILTTLCKTKLQHISSQSFNYIKVLSGATFGDRNSLVFLVSLDSNPEKRYILKVYDPFRTSQFYTNGYNIKQSYLDCLKVFNKEISAYSILDGNQMVPKLYASGFISSDPDRYVDQIDIAKPPKVCGFFLLLTYFEGRTLSQVKISERNNYKAACLRAIDEVHSFGIAHNDLHSGNIIVSESINKYGRINYEAKIIDFGYRYLALDRNNWKRNNKRPKKYRSSADLTLVERIEDINDIEDALTGGQILHNYNATGFIKSLT